MLTVGITGNMGSGKSTVSKVFQVLGVPVFAADNAAKNLYERPAILTQVVALAGPDILDEDGRLDRRSLAARMFTQPTLAGAITALIHPLVMDDFRAWTHTYRSLPYVMLEAAILFESGLASCVDKIILVSCPEALSTLRIMQRDGLSKEQIQQRMAFQWPESRKAERTDLVIINDGKTLIIPQILAIHQQLVS